MIRQGAFDALRNRRIELVHGELREMTPPGPKHEDVVDILAGWSFSNTLRDKIRVRVQNSLGLPRLESAPQPDIAWVAARSYSDQRPQPSDVLLVVEVADSSLDYDRGPKAALYASGEIADYWVVNIPQQLVEVRRQPRDGEYTSLQSFEFTDNVIPLADPSLILPVRTLFEKRN